MPLYAGEVNAPDFPPGLDWINTARPLSIRDLRGKLVLLDFWTFCCINCLHILPDLQKLERKYSRELVVIGVHSAKFSAERETENVRQAVLRYQIEHPVVNDPGLWMWRQYAVRGWPSVVLIDPQGKVIGGHSGEGIFEPFDEIIAKVIASFDAEGLLDRSPLDLSVVSRPLPSLLSFPGKVLADTASGRLFIADSNHNRIVGVSLDDGAVEEVIGHGESGFTDGDFETARFRNPQGLALDGEHLYIADTDNHALRRADLTTGRVETIAGTGRQSRDFGSAPGLAKGRALNSPWDLALHDGRLFIAMAGPHQIWKLHLATGRLGGHAGSGAEARLDGPLNEAALAQPSGLATDGHKLYFADSEVSSIRAADLDPRGRVTTIVGQDLFEFGDVDGAGDQVRLQHPLGVAWVEDSLYVADTYNNKIKRVFPATRAAWTFAGAGRAGLSDGPAEEALFNEPAGLAAAGGKLYVADTNNHSIRVIDLATRQVSTLQLGQLHRLTRWRAPVTRLEPHRVQPGDATLLLTLELPPGSQWNPDVPITAYVSVGDQEEERTTHPPGVPLQIFFHAPAGDSVLRLDLTAYYCSTGREAVCLVHEENLEIPLDGDPTASTSAIEIHRAVH